MRAGGGGVPYERGLDGLRAIAVAVVLLFHADVPGFGGGFLGVSVFFTLSGFLITSLLLHEHDRTGTIALKPFWGRRARRLLPASLLTLVLVSVLVAPLLDAAQRAALPGDVAASALDVANWHFLLGGTSYADLFAGPSPLLHFWSLAIEEQFYVVFPLIALIVLRRAGRVGLGIITVVLIGGAVAATFASSDPDVVYYATYTRAAELLAGVLLAVLLHGRRPATGGATARIAAVGGLAGLGLLGLLVSTTDELDAGWYEGGLAAFSIVSCLLVVAALVPGPLRALCSLGPLVVVGRVSYGLYLFHWPVFVVLDRARTGLDGPALLLVRLGVTAALTSVSYHLLESPIRFRRRLASTRPALMALAATASILVVAVIALQTGRPAPPVVGAPAPAVPGRPLSLDDGPIATTAPARTTTVLVVGSDERTAAGLAALGLGGPGVDVVDATSPQCPLATPVVPTDAPCADPAIAWPELVDRVEPDVVVVAAGAVDRRGQQPSPDEQELLRLGQVSDEVIGAVSAVATSGKPVLLVDAVGVDDAVGGALSTADLRHDNVERVSGADRLAETIESLAEPVEDLRTRVLVVGDSTSYLFASSLTRMAADRFAVSWAGGNNCPVVPVAELRWWEGAQWDMSACPQPSTHWDLESGVDVVVVVASLTEQADQRYQGEQEWSVAGDPLWVARHEEWMAGAVASLSDAGAVVVVADAPPIDRGAFSGSAMARPERLAAWNGQIASWERRWANVGVLAYAGPLVAVEAAQGPVRGDGVHLDPAVLDSLMASSYADTLSGLVEDLEARALKAGCRERLPEGAARLDVARCDLAAAGALAAG